MRNLQTMEKKHGEADRKRQMEEEEEQIKEAKAMSRVGNCVSGISGDGGGSKGVKRESDDCQDKGGKQEQS